MDYLQLDIDSLGNGVLRDLFNELVPRVLDNIADPNTSAKQGRAISFEVKFKPNEERRQVSVTVQSRVRLAPTRPAESIIYVSTDGQKQQAFTVNPDQPQLPGADFGNVRHIDGGR